MNAQTIQAVGLALLHFFWQGAALAVLLWIAISFTRNARIGYALAVGALALMALCPLATLMFLARPSTVPMTADYTKVSPAISNITIALTTAAPATSFDWLSCLVGVWCIGVCLFAMRAFGGWIILQKLRRTAREAIDPNLLALCHRLQQRIGIKAIVRYAYSEIVNAPAVVGWFRPVVLIPLSAIAGLSVEQLEAIIAHELAHVRRYDALVNLFQIAVETVLFYHPAVWWVNRVIRTERENCCDDLAVTVCGNASDYARALAMIGGSGALPVWAMAANGGALKARVGRLLGIERMAHGIPRAGLAVLAVLCASCVVVAAGVLKQDVQSTPPLPPPPAAPVEQLPLRTPPDPDPISAKVQQNVEIDRVEETLKRLSNKLVEAEKADNHPVTAVQLRALEIAAESEELQRMITSMKRRYVDEYPDLIAAKERLALLTRERDYSAEVAAEEKPEEQGGPSYIDSLASAGLTKLTVDELISLKTQGVTAEYVRQIKATGLDPNVHDLITLKIQGVSPEYIRGVLATGLKPNLHELISMKIQDVTPELIRALQSAGLGNLSTHDFITAKIQGVTPEFIEKIHSHGFKDLTFHQLVSLKIAGVF